MARVILYAHRLRATSGTGVQRYTDRLLASLDEVASTEWELAAASPDSVVPDHRARVAYRRVPLPRKAIHGLWSMAGFPPLEVLAGRADLVHLLSTAIPVPSWAPQVVTIHDLFTARHPEWFEPRSAGVTLRTLHRAARFARRLIVPSAFVARDLTATLGVDPMRITVVPEGVTARFQTRQTGEEQATVVARYEVRPLSYAVTIGLLSPRKNLRVLGEAWALLRSRSGSAVPTLLVIGPEDIGHNAIRTELQKLDLGDSVRFVGYVPDHDLPSLLANAIALVHPSLDEGFGLTPLEAMAAGVPALVSNAGAIPEVTGDAAWQLDPYDPEAWADAVATIWDDAARRATLIEAGRRRAAEFSWDASARATLAVYRDALAAG